MSLLRWKLPPRPDHPDYRDLLAQIELERKRDPIKAMAWFAAVAESDFWFWQKYVMPLGGLKIADKHHPRKGSLIVDEPWFFDRMREVQEDFDAGRSDVLYQWFRGSFKTTTIIQGGSLWFLAKNPMETIAIFTHKVDQVGESMGGMLASQVRNNDILRRHWPQFRTASKISDTLTIVGRPEGPKEPSISIHPILGSAASGHYTKILIDDAVTERIARSPEDCKRVDEQLSFIQPLRRDDTQYYYVATPYGDADPVYKRAQKGKFFTRISRHPGLLPGNVPQLYSLKYFQALARTMEDQHFSSQILLKIMPKGGAYFRREWLRRYRMTALQAGKNCRVHIIVDMAEGKENSDFTTVRVYGFTSDKRRRVLDLWREKMGLTDTADLLFGVMPGEEALPGNEWKPEGGLVKFWQQCDPELDVSVEEVGSTGHAETFRREMAHRKRMDNQAVSCTVRSLRSQRKKENRIAKLQPEYRNGAFEYPEDLVGFGHGSATTGDGRDTLEQFIDDEYKQWTLAGETLNDDMLDTEAWTVQPETHFSFPDPSEEEMYVGGIPIDPARLESGYAGSSEIGWREASWRVF